MEYVKLNNGVEMPIIGFGVFQVTDLTVCEESVYNAVKVGYRSIDTAAAYYNEEAVGRGIKRAIDDGLVTREELFITTKLWVQDFGYESALKAFDVSMKKLGLEYLDLYLMHQSYGDVFGAWRAMEKLYADKKVRAIGISNFSPARMVDLILRSDVVPAVHQVEHHPYYQQKEEGKVMKEYGVQMEGWSPFASGMMNIFDDEVLKKIAAKHGKTVAQVILRWDVQKGVAVVPKSTHVERMQQNIDVFDFVLDDEDMAAITKLDEGRKPMADINTVDFVKMLSTFTIHE